jgi:hypothetical protein
MKETWNRAFSTIHLKTWRGVVLEGCHAEVAKILTWRCLETHDGTQQQTVKEFTANRCPIFEPGTADDS